MPALVPAPSPTPSNSCDLVSLVSFDSVSPSCPHPHDPLPHHRRLCLLLCGDTLYPVCAVALQFRSLVPSSAGARVFLEMLACWRPCHALGVWMPLVTGLGLQGCFDNDERG